MSSDSSSKSICSKCGKECKDKRGLSIHEGKCTGPEQFVCMYCNVGFCSKHSLSRHSKTCKHVEDYEAKEEKKEKIQELEDKISSIMIRQKTLDQCHEYDIKRRQEAEDSLIKEKKEMETKIDSLSKLVSELEQERLSLLREIKGDKTRALELASKIADNTGSSYVQNHTIQNIQHNHFNTFPFDPSFIQGRISPPDVTVIDTQGLVHHLFNLGLSNYFRIGDKTRKTARWIKSDGEVVKTDSQCKELSNHIVKALKDEMVSQKAYFQQELDYYQGRDILDHEKINELEECISFCTSVINEEQYFIKDLGNIIADRGKNKEDTSLDTVKEYTFYKFTSKLESILLSNLSEWVDLSFFEMGKYIGKRLTGFYYKEGASEENLYIIIQRDDDRNVITYSLKLQDHIKKSVHEKMFKLENSDMIKQLFMFHKYPRAMEKYQYLENPSIEQTLEIMKGILVV